MWLENLGIAWSGLLRHKLRSLLTLGSIAIGSFSIVFMSSLAESGLASLNAGLEAIGGARLLALWDKRGDERPQQRSSYFRGLTKHDIRLLRGLPHVTEMTHIADLSRRELEDGTGETRRVDVVAADANFFQFFRYVPREGRLFDRTDTESHARVCVLGNETARRMELDGPPVLLRFITVMGLRCRVIGRLQRVARWDVPLGWDWDDVVVLPFDAMADHAATEVNNNHWLLLHTDSSDNNELVVRVVNALILNRHNNLTDFYLLNFHKNFIEEMMKIYRIMKIIVSIISGIALWVGGLGVMNIMLVSVSERVREIGIRRALGASARDIGQQFLLEAVLLAGLGGGLGVGIGLLGGALGGFLIQQVKPEWMIVLSHPAVGLALSVSVLVGVIFGYAPAQQASRMDPVAAIRTGT